MTRTKTLLLVAVPLSCALGFARATLDAQQAAAPSGIDLEAMDRTADPCGDFYQFTCGGWIAKHPLPADQPIYGRFNELQERIASLVGVSATLRQADATRVKSPEHPMARWGVERCRQLPDARV